MNKTIKHSGLGEAAVIDDAFVENLRNDPDSDPFLYSLENLTQDDLGAPPEKKKRSFSDIIYEGARKLLLLICAGVFIYSMVTVAKSLIAYRQAEDLYQNLSSSMFDTSNLSGFEDSAYPPLALPAKPSKPADFLTALNRGGDSALIDFGGGYTPRYNKRVELMKSMINTLIIKNSDTFGWIKAEETVIDYPIVLGEDNDFYLDHAYDRSSLPAGAIFADYRCSRTLTENFHLILYGHNMKNGLMFNGATKYLNEDFFSADNLIEVSTPDGIFTYKVFSVYEARYDDDYIRVGFGSWNEFIEYVKGLEARSMYHLPDFEVKEDDRLLTLSTCTNGAWTQRYAIHAILTSYEL